MSEIFNLAQLIEQSPYKNVYWLARDLINTDKYGAIGTSKERLLLETVNMLENIMGQKALNDEEKCKILKATIQKQIFSMYKEGTKGRFLIEAFVDKLNENIESVVDVVVFCFTVKYVIVPINDAMKRVPSDDADFNLKQAETVLETLGETGAGKVIKIWDSLGEKGCLTAERIAVIEEFSKLLNNISSLKSNHSNLDDHLMMTAFVQEFERRLGQKRKARGGKSLESVTDFLFNYYKFSSTSAPSHFDQDLEVDKWFKCKENGWVIGISCKRTLRERWKQLSSASTEVLSHHKIKQLWNIITYDKDLSDDKIVRLGMQRHIFYLDDKSDVYNRCKDNIGTKDYVRPLSQLIKDIREEHK